MEVQKRIYSPLAAFGNATMQNDTAPLCTQVESKNGLNLKHHERTGDVWKLRGCLSELVLPPLSCTHTDNKNCLQACPQSREQRR